MNRTFVGSLVAAAFLLGSGFVGGGGRAHAQVVIQGQGQAGGVYGQGTVYVQPGPTTQPVQGPIQAQPSPYVGVAQTQPQPVRTIVHTSPTMALLVPGVIALAGGWLISGAGSVALLDECSFATCPYPQDEWVGYSWIPVIGPWLAFGVTDPGEYGAFNVIMGVVQGAGLILTVLGLVIQQEWEEAIYAGVDLGEGRTLAFDGGGPGTQVGATLTF